MLQIIRDKAQGVVAWSIISLIIITFALWGVDNFQSNGVRAVAAKVNGQKISWHDVEALYHHYYNSLVRSNPQALQSIDNNLLREQARQLLVSQLAFKTQSSKAGYSITSEQIKDKIMNDESFQDDGKFSVDKYKQVLRQFGQTPEIFEDNIKTGMMAEQSQLGLSVSSFALRTEVDQMMFLWTQTRNFGYVVIPTSNFYKNIHLSEKEISEYYQQHQQIFIAPEQVKISYINFNIADFAKSIEVNEEQLHLYYDEHKDFYTEAEGVQVRHLFINAPTNSSLEQSDEAKAKIEDLLAQIKLGSDFVTMAKRHSEDPGSAIKGGDIGFKGRGEVVVAFEDAAFALRNVDDLSDVVQTEFGFHILQLIKRRDRTLKDYSEVREQIAFNYQLEYAAAHFEEKGEELANLAFETPDSLEKVAMRLELKVEESNYFSRKGGVGISSEKMVVDAAFNDKILTKNRNSNLLKLDDERYVVLRVIEHKLASPQSLDDVRTEIEAKIMQIEASKHAKKLGDKLLNALNSGETPYKLSRTNKLEWVANNEVERNSPKVNPAILQQAFSLVKPVTANINKGFALSSGDYVVISLSKVESETAGKTNDEIFTLKKERLHEQLSQHISKTEFQLYQNSLIKMADIKLEKLP